MLTEQTLKTKLRTGDPVIGIWNTLGSPLVTEALSAAGLDFQIIDLEHGPFILDQIHLHVSACENVGKCSALVRIPVVESWMALQALDQGSHGIVVPHISTVSDLESFRKWSRYPPQGGRGFSPFTKAGGFGSRPAGEYSDLAETALVNVAIVESREGLCGIERLLEDDFVDVFYFGAYDLSIQYGSPGDMRNKELIVDIEQGARKVRDAGKYAGGFVPTSKEELKWNLDLGLNFVTYSVDSEVIRSGINKVVKDFSVMPQ